MGIGSSRIISYDDAVHRCSAEEEERFRKAFQRLSPKGVKGTMDKSTFMREVLGDNVPRILSERIYGVFDSDNKGSLSFKDFLCGLVVFAKGTAEERTQFIFNICDVQGNGEITRAEMETILSSTDGDATTQKVIADCFQSVDKFTLDEFREWARENQSSTTLTTWIFENAGTMYDTGANASDEQAVTLSQSLASVTNFNETDIKDLERKYYEVKGKTPNGVIEKETLVQLLCPPLPTALAHILFDTFDDNKDGSVDFRELVCGLSGCIRGSDTQRMKFCFNLFDSDEDGKLSRPEMTQMVKSVWRIEDVFESVDSLSTDEISQLVAASSSSSSSSANSSTDAEAQAADDAAAAAVDDVADAASSSAEVGKERPKRMLSDALSSNAMEELVDAAFAEYDRDNDDKITFAEYMQWVESNPAAIQFLQVINKVASLDLGLKPVSSDVEREYMRELLDKQSVRGKVLGDCWYVVSYAWWSAYEKYLDGTTGAGDGGDDASGSSARFAKEIDNVDLIDPKAEFRMVLRQGIKENHDYVLVSKPIWSAIFSWYGGGPPLPRYVVAAGFQGKAMVELYPLTLRILTKYPKEPEKMSSKKAQRRLIGFTVSFSRFNTVSELQAHVAAIRNDQRTSMRMSDGKLVTDPELQVDKLRLWNCFDLAKPTLLTRGDVTLEDAQIVNGQNLFMEVQTDTGEWPEEQTLSAKADAEEEEVEVEPGLTGLKNLGNTCFMNSAVQCLSNTPFLTPYILNDFYMAETNTVNPIGYKGLIAKRYGELIKQLWAGKAHSIAPLKFRWTIGKFNPEFNTPSQQDSQEFLAYLLDGLHEDLNRVLDKPPTEYKDSEGRPDKEVADEYWDTYKMRDQSVIVDLMTGQMKASTQCNECGFETVKFETFRTLSLPLPVDTNRWIELVLFPYDGTQTPVQYGVKMTAQDKIGDLRRELAALAGLDVEQVLVVDLGNGYVSRILNDNQSVDMVRNNSYAFEIKPLLARSGRTVDVTLPASALESQSRSGGVGRGGVELVFPDKKKQGEETPAQQEQEVAEADDNEEDEEAEEAEEAEEGEEVVELEELEEVIMVSFIHRKLIREEVYFINPYKPQLFGLPRLFTENIGGWTNRQLYHHMWNNVKRSFQLSRLPKMGRGEEEDEAQEEEEEGEEEYVTPGGDENPNEHEDDFPFVLRVVNAAGTGCGRCSWNKFCIGHAIACDDEALDLQDGETVALDWDLVVVSMYYSWAAERQVETHASVEENREVRNQPIDLQECFNWFTQSEKMSDDEVWRCPKCKDLREATRKLDLWKMPPVLIVHLKRFQLLHGRAWVKSHKIVNFDHEGLDLNEYSVNEEEEFPVYDLYAVTNHFGGLGGGHYIAHCKHPELDKWHCYNDSMISEVEEDAVDGSSAYVLFYKQRGVDVDLSHALDKDNLTVTEVDSEDEDNEEEKCLIL